MMKSTCYVTWFSLSLLVMLIVCNTASALEPQTVDMQPSSGSASASASTSTSHSSSASWEIDPQTVFIFELFVAGIVFSFLVMFIIGTRQNLSLARRISNILTTALSYQFAQFGTEPGKQMTRDGSFYYWYFATGRRYTPGLTVAFDLARRMDIFAYTSAFMSTPQKDRLIYYLPVSDDVSMDHLSLFIFKRRELSKLRAAAEGQKKVAVLDAMAADVVDIPGVPSDLIVMTEHADIATALLPESIRDLLTTHSSSIISVHVTEQGTNWDVQSSMAQRLIRLECALPLTESRQAPIITDMARLALHLLDAVATCKVSPAAKKRITELRKRAAAEKEKREQKARAEEAANRRLEKKKKEEEAVSKMSAEKQRKYEEKKRKKELAARMKKAVKK